MSDRLDRREFARKLTLASVTVGWSAGAVAGQDQPPVTAPKPDDSEAAAETPPPRPAHELLAEMIAERYPHENLTPEVVASIGRDIRGHLSRGPVLRSVVLPNGAAPFTFRAQRAD